MYYSPESHPKFSLEAAAALSISFPREMPTDFEMEFRSEGQMARDGSTKGSRRNRGGEKIEGGGGEEEKIEEGEKIGERLADEERSTWRASEAQSGGRTASRPLAGVINQEAQ